MLIHGACVMHNYDDLPEGWVEIQRDDDLALFADDGEAARACSTEAREHRIVGERYVWIVPAKDVLRPLTPGAERLIAAGYRIDEGPWNLGHFEVVIPDTTIAGDPGRTVVCGRFGRNGRFRFCGYTKKRQPESVALLHVGAVTAEDIELFIEHTRGAS